MQVSDAKLRSLKPQSKPYLFSVGDGLSLEVQPGGSKTWVYRYRQYGKAQAIRFGRYPLLSLLDARQKRIDAARLLIDGMSPAEKKRAEKARPPEAITVKEFWDDYRKHVLEPARKNLRDIDRFYKKDIEPYLGGTSVKDVSSADVLKVIDRVRLREAPLSALAVRNLLKRIFDYARDRLLIASNPVDVIRPKSVAVPKSRDRNLSVEEIRIYLTRLYEAGIHRRYKLALHLILITLVRKSEMVLAKWADVDYEAAEWRIPDENDKEARSRIVYLSPQAIRLFKELQQFADGNEWVLPGRNKPRQPICASSLNSMLAEIDFGIPHFTIHDSRRTASTLLNNQDWSSDWIEKQLGHEMGGVRGIYNKAEYEDKRRAMLNHWGQFIDSVMTEQRVIQGNFRRVA